MSAERSWHERLLSRHDSSHEKCSKIFPLIIEPLFCVSEDVPANFPPKKHKNLAHRNRSDFCDLRLRCPSRTPEIARFPRQEKAMLHCDLRVRWKVDSDLRFRAAISEPKTPSFCGISGDLAQSTRKSLVIAIVRFWCPPILAFFDFLAFFVFRFSLLFCAFFLSFPRILGVP